MSLQVLQQENFVIKKDLQLIKECNNSLIDDLRLEISSLQDSINNRGMQLQTYVIENNGFEKELKEQNQRLSKQLFEATERESELRKTLHNLREKSTLDRDTLQDHFSYIESLKGEISHTLDKKYELERHVSDLMREKESLSESLDYSVGKILSLEKKQRDQENILRSNERELDELKSSNQFLMEKLENWSFSRTSSNSCNASILSELEMSSSDNGMSPNKRFD